MAKFVRPTSTLGGDPSGSVNGLSAAAANDRIAGDTADDLAITSAPASSALGLQAQRQRLPVFKQRKLEARQREFSFSLTRQSLSLCSS